MATGVRSVSGSKSSDVPVIRSRVFMMETQRMHTLPNLLRENGSELIPDADCQGKKMEAGRAAPIVSINDLSKGDARGDTVRITLGHQLTNEPTMCCDTMEGREEALTESDFELTINQTRHGVLGGCTMDTLRLGKNTFMRAKPLLSQYFCRLEQERCLYHLAGARGHYYNASDMILPTADSPKFASAMINCVTPPTFCRHFYGGDATSLDGSCGDAITSTDIFDLHAISKMKAAMEEASHPLMKIRWGDSDAGDAMYVLLVTPRQWHTFQATADAQQWMMMVAQAVQRGKACGDHPIFHGECLMYEGILVKKYSQPVRFLPGKAVEVCNNDDHASTHIERLPIGSNFAVDRAILLGGQALAEAYGSVNDADGKHLGKLNFQFWSDTFDGGDKHRTHIKWMSGMKKIRFPDKFGHVYDRGVAVLDTAVPLSNNSKC